METFQCQNLKTLLELLREAGTHQDVAPEVFSSGGFAMKGGRAINLSHSSMPRLSMDIDVVFTDRTLSREGRRSNSSSNEETP